jgi:thiol-disulfide isomerase/thioredoxin
MLIPKLQTILEQVFSGVVKLSPQQNQRSDFLGGLLVGLSLGLLWTPCVGPILASVISLAVTGTVTLDTLIITFFYSLGTAIPMMAIILGGRKIFEKLPWLTKNTSLIQKTFGVVMILTAIGIFTNIDRKFQSYILNKFPNYGVGLTKIEEIKPVSEQLKQLTGTNILTGDLGKPSSDLTAKIAAPEIIPGGVWLNSSPLSISELRGKVVLIDFWTYSCINCQRTFPYLKSWWQKYSDKGLVIIGVHSPEFEFEKDEKNLRMAISDFQLPYPIVQDNNFATWRAFNNNYWPAKYIIDKNGFIRYTHFGEGNYDEEEHEIQTLLLETGAKIGTGEIKNPTYQIYAQTPETYLGYGRLANFASPESVLQDATANYSFPSNLTENNVAYEGQWILTKEYANPQKGAKLRLDFDAKEVFLVMRSKTSISKLKVLLDGEQKSEGIDATTGTINVNQDRLYKLINLSSQGRHTLELEFEDNNCEIFAFTFG